MTPIFAIVGRPNVGKSTLFNRLTRTRDALVHDKPGLTRDRQYGHGDYLGQSFILIDTGGISEPGESINDMIAKQALLAVTEADVILFVVDAKSGLTPTDQRIAQKLREQQKPVMLIVNKTEGIDSEFAASEFYELGLGDIYRIAAAHNQGINDLTVEALSIVPEQEENEEILDEKTAGIKFALVGCPNVGKSTLVNCILGEERVVVYDQPGTTRDSVFIPFERRGQAYTLIDTAGLRRRAKTHEIIEKFSAIKSLKAIENANVAIILIDAKTEVSDQDLHIMSYVLDAGRALVIAVNKWDGLDEDQRDKIKKDIDRRLTFVDFAKVHFISALHGTGVGDLFQSVNKAYQSATKKISTSELSDVLVKAVQAHQPPKSSGRAIKLRYAHLGGNNPPRIVIHGNRTNSINKSYIRYLENTFRKAFNLVGTPIRIEFKTSENPYKGRRNILSRRQLKKRDRIRGRR